MKKGLNLVGAKSGIKNNLTRIEAEVLRLLTDEFLTPQKIAIRRKTSDKAVYKMLKRLREKGAYNIGLQKVEKRVEKKQGTFQPSNNQIRLHAQEFNIKILYRDIRYKKLLEKSNLLDIDGNTIRLYRYSIEIYSGHSFYADDEHKATSDSIAYWKRLFVRLEHELNIIIVKPRSQNIRQVKAEFAEINNELARDYRTKREKLRIYADDDGKLCFVVDYSLSVDEFEAVHPKTAKQDIGKIKGVFNDLRTRESYLPSDSKIMIDKLTMLQEGMTKEYVANIKKHLSVLDNINNSFKKFNRLLSQKKITEF